MMGQNIPQPRIPKLPVAQLLQKIPAEPDAGSNAYDAPAKEGEKGGLPMEICAFAQTMYAMPTVNNTNSGQGMALQPGWGGQGR